MVYLGWLRVRVKLRITHSKTTIRFAIHTSMHVYVCMPIYIYFRVVAF